MIDSLTLDRLWEGAAEATVWWHAVRLDSLARARGATADLAIELAGCGANDDDVRTAWTLFDTMVETLLPFGDPDLALEDRMRELCLKVEGRDLPTPGMALAAVEALCAVATNPKRDVLEKIVEAVPDGEEIFVWNRPRGTLPLGWSDAAPEKVLSFREPPPRILRGVRDLPSRGDVLVVTSSPDRRRVDEERLLRIMRSGRFSEVHVLLYTFERHVHRTIPLVGRTLSVRWQCERDGREVQLSHGQEEESEPPSVGSTEREPVERDVDPRGQEREWKAGEEDEMAEAVCLEFPGGERVLVAKRDRLLVAEGTEAMEVEAFSIAAGDRVVQHFGGNRGDGFVLHADGLLRDDGRERGEIMSLIGTFKEGLRECLRAVEPDRLAADMTRHGVTGVSPGRIRAWSGEEVIAPQQRATFDALVSVLWSRGHLRAGGDHPGELSARIWIGVELIRRANRLGGKIFAGRVLDALREALTRRRTPENGDIVEVELDGERHAFPLAIVTAVRDCGAVPRSRLGAPWRTSSWLD